MLLRSLYFLGGIGRPLYLSLSRDVEGYRLSASDGRDDTERVIDGPSGMVYKSRSSAQISGIG